MEESSLSEHGEDKDHGLWPQTEPSEKNLERTLGVCRKKCRLLWWMLVLDPQEMQWHQRFLAP